MTDIQVKVCVLGGGPAGYVAAIRAAQLGASVALVERAELGGTCLNRGCIPTKALLRGAGVFDTVAHAGAFGVTVPAGAVTYDARAALARQQAVVRALRAGLSQLMRKNGVTVCRGAGTVEAPDRVRVEGDEPETEIRCGRLILAAGSAPLVPPIPGSDSPGVLTSDDALRTAEVPARVVVVGGGVVGVEFAQYYRALGSAVTVVEMRERILPEEDPEVTAALARVLKKRGVKLRTGVRVERIVPAEDGLHIRIAQPETAGADLVSDRVLLAAGRRLCGLTPDVAALGVRALRGAITVDDRMRTSVEGVYAAGDAVGGRLLAHLAFAQGRIAAENAMGLASSAEHLAVPACVYTEPEIASVGLSEPAARAAGRDVVTGRFDFRANGRSLTLGNREGFVKVVADRQSGVLLGASLFGPEAGELISELTLAVTLGVRAEQLGDMVHPHPTLSEAVAEACADAAGRAIHK